jgi:transcriptional regulator
MALYVPRKFAVDAPSAIEALIDEHPFATLITPAAPEPYVSHVPLLREPRADGGIALIGHFARANPHWEQAAGTVSVAIFHGPHAYVSPTWYEAPADAVPTWNFATVHVHGSLEFLTAPAQAERVLEALVERFEGRGDDAWRFAMTGRQREAMVSNIVAFRIVAQRVSAKNKLSQNRAQSDRRRVIDTLEASTHAESRATAAWMRRFAQPDG